MSSKLQSSKIQTFKGKRKLNAYCASKKRTLHSMNFDTNLIKIGGELRKLWSTEYFNIVGMGVAILHIY